MGNPVEDYVDCYQNLANAIILLAVKDYKTILRCLIVLSVFPNSSIARAMFFP